MRNRDFEGIVDTVRHLRRLVFRAPVIGALISWACWSCDLITPAQGDESRYRIELQTGPQQPRFVTFNPAHPYRFIVVDRGQVSFGREETGGEITLWDASSPSQPARVLTILTMAADATFSNDGNSIVSLASDGTLRWWSMDGDTIRQVMTIHRNAAAHLCVSPTLLATAGTDGSLQLWSADGLPIGDSLHQGSPISSLACSPDGRVVASAGKDGVRLWGSNGSLIGSISRASGVSALAFSQTGDLLATGEDGGKIQLWKLDGTSNGDWSHFREEQSDGLQDRKYVSALAFSPKRDLLASAGSDGMIRLWDLNGNPRGSPLIHTYASNDDPIFGVGVDFSVAISGSGDLLVSAGGGIVRVWNMDGSHLGQPFQAGPDVRSIALNLTADTIATADRAGRIRLWNVDGTQKGKAFQHGAPDKNFSLNRYGTNVAFSPKNSVLASSGLDGFVRFWTLDGAPWGQPLDHGAPVWSMAFSPDAEILASGGEDGIVKLWDLNSFSAMATLNHGFVNHWSNSFSGIGITTSMQNGLLRVDSLISASAAAFAGIKPGDLVVRIDETPVEGMSFEDARDRLRGEPGTNVHLGIKRNGAPQLLTFNLIRKIIDYVEPPAVTSIAFSPQGGLLATGDSAPDGTIRLWSADGSSRSPLFMPSRGEPIEGLTFSPGGDYLLSLAGDSLAYWNLDGSLRRSTATDERDSYSLALADSAGADLFATGGFDGVRLWNLDGTPRAEPLKIGTVRSLALSPRGDLLAAGGVAGLVHLWRLGASPRGEPAIRNRFDTDAHSVVFSPSGAFLASASNDGTIRFWNVDGTPRGEPLRHGKDLRAVRFLGSDNELASEGGGYVVLWKLDGSWKDTRIRLGSEVRSVATSPKGDVLAVGKNDAVELWNREGSLISGPMKHLNESKVAALELQDLAFSSDGSEIASLDNQGTIRLWGRDGSAKLSAPIQSDARIIVFSPRNMLLASGGSNDDVQLWNLDGTPNGGPLRMGGMVTSVAFSPDGKFLAASGHDGLVKLWDVDSRTEHRWEIGIPIEQIGFFANSIWALTEGSQLLFSRIRFPLSWTARMMLAPGGALVMTSGGQYFGQGPLLDRVFVFRDDARIFDATELIQRVSREEAIAAVTGQQDALRIVVSYLVNIATRVEGGYEVLPGWARPLVWSIGGYVSLVFCVGLLWAARPADLATIAMRGKTSSPSEGRKLWMKVLTLVRWLGETQRSLDAWLREHDDELFRRCFEEKPTVQRRLRYIDLGNSADASCWIDEIVRKRYAAYWIFGPGGCGKSTLAFHLARSARNAAVFPILPIVVEEDWVGSLVDHVGEVLWIEEVKPTRKATEKLLRSGRLVLVVDGVTERRVTASENQLAELVRRGAVRNLLVTSRDAPPKDSTFRNVNTGPLDDTRLVDFIRAYASEDEVEDILVALRRLSQHQPMRPLFARLAIDRLHSGARLPDSYPQLIQDYVLAVRPAGQNALSESDFLRVVSVIAFACLRDNLAASGVTIEFLRGHIDAESDRLPFTDDDGQEVPSTAIINQLVSCGLLQRTVEFASSHVRFTEDLIAEYLAAMHVVNQENEKSRLLRDRVARSGTGLVDAIAHVREALGRPTA